MWLVKFPPLLPQSRIPKGPSPSCGALVCPTRSQSRRLPPDPRFSSNTLLLCPSEWETHNSTYSRLWPSYLPAVPLEFGGRGGQTRVAGWSRAPSRPSPLLPAQGKFIRIHFGTTGKLAGADIESCESGCFWRVLGAGTSYTMRGVQHTMKARGSLFKKCYKNFKTAAEGLSVGSF